MVTSNGVAAVISSLDHDGPCSSFSPPASFRFQSARRLVTATKTDLKQLAAEGRFLEDLYYRLNDFPLRVPPLRERKGDIGMLAEYFLERYQADFGKRLQGIGQAAAESAAEAAGEADAGSKLVTAEVPAAEQQ